MGWIKLEGHYGRGKECRGKPAGWVIGFIRDPPDTADDVRMYLMTLYLHWTVTT